MGIGDIVRLLLGKPSDPPRPSCRLAEAEALEIARRATNERGELGVYAVTRTPRGAEWGIHTPARGAGVQVRIDDTTGEVIEIKRWRRR